MPKNHFQNRPIWSHRPDCLLPGDKVKIIEKEKQGTLHMEDLVEGFILRVLSKGKYYKNGAKVEIINEKNAWTSEEREKIIKRLKKEQLTATQLDEMRRQFTCTIGRVQYVDFDS